MSGKKKTIFCSREGRGGISDSQATRRTFVMPHEAFYGFVHHFVQIFQIYHDFLADDDFPSSVKHTIGQLQTANIVPTLKDLGTT